MCTQLQTRKLDVNHPQRYIDVAALPIYQNTGANYCHRFVGGEPCYKPCLGPHQAYFGASLSPPSNPLCIHFDPTIVPDRTVTTGTRCISLYTRKGVDAASSRWVDTQSTDNFIDRRGHRASHNKMLRSHRIRFPWSGRPSKRSCRIHRTPPQTAATGS